MSFLRKFGAQEYQRQRGEAQPHIQFVINQAVRDRKLSNPADKEAAIDEVLPYIRAVTSRLQKREYFDIAMDSLRIGDATVKRELWQSIRSSVGTRVPVVANRTQLKPTVAERQLLELVLSDQDLRLEVFSRLDTEDYEGLATAPSLSSPEWQAYGCSECLQWSRLYTPRPCPHLQSVQPAQKR